MRYTAVTKLLLSVILLVVVVLIILRRDLLKVSFSGVSLTPKKQPTARKAEGITAVARTSVFPHHDNNSATMGVEAELPALQTQKIENLQMEQHLRLERIKRICSRYKIKGGVEQLYTYSSRRISYCSSHKVASTYWIQVFRFLHKDIPPGVKKPAEIPKFYTHLAPLKMLKKGQFLRKQDYEETMQNYRFMMARDPYERLWSVYIDKYVLLDLYFWQSFSKRIRDNFLRYAGDTRSSNPPRWDKVNNITDNNKDQRARSNKTRVSSYESNCRQLSFEEFLIYVATLGKTSLDALNDHFQPIHIGCNPCRFKPDFIGHVETFIEEKSFLLKKIGLAPDIDGMDNYKDHIHHEIVTLSQFQFQLLSMSSFISCLTMKNIQERIAVAFVLNGYLPLDSLDTLGPLLPLSKNQFVNQLIQLFMDSNRTSDDIHQQRATLRKDAYKQIPYQTLLALKDIFKNDFLLFGYDPLPAYIFEERIDFDVKKILGDRLKI